MSLLHRQPWKLFYLVYFATKVIFVKLPYWTLISIRQSQRPRPSWSLGKCLRIYMMRTVMDSPFQLGSLDKRDRTLVVPDSELPNAKFVWVEGLDEESILGTVRRYASAANVKPTRIPGYWQFKEGRLASDTLQANVDEKVVYHLHGGAYILGSAHPSDGTARIPRDILKISTAVSRSFAVDYRLSASAPFRAENPFPSALLDSIAGYRYLTELGFRPENIILSGDSAGGNLALALSQYLISYTDSNMSPPGRLLLLSPWGDMSDSLTSPTSSRIMNEISDIFPLKFSTTGGLGSYGVRSYLGAAGPDELKLNEYISPASPHLTHTDGMFTAFPRTYILAGGAEVLLDDSKVIAERMKADSSSDGWVILDVVEDAVHDFIVFPWAEPERGDALGRICRWLDQV